MGKEEGPGRGSPIARAFKLVRHLLDGKTLDRYSAADILGLKHAAAAERLKSAARLFDLDVRLGVNGRRTYTMRKLSWRRLRDNEVVAFCLGAALAPIFRGSAHEAGMRSARDVVTSTARFKRTNLNRKFGFVPRGGELALPERAGELDEIIDALLRDETLTARYQHFGGNKEELLLHPLTLLVHEHQLYLMAYRKAPSDARPYRFARLSDVDRTGDHFTYPSKAEYDLEALFRDAFGIFLNYSGPVEHVVVQLTTRWSTYVAGHRWHGSQKVVQTADGPRVELSVRVCPELVAWVRSFGPDAVVIAPESLRVEVQGCRTRPKRQRGSR